MIKVLSLFSGIGAFEKALDRQGIKHEVVAFCEIDKFASKSYSAIHGIPESMNLGDITKVKTEALPDFDLLTWGFPCQDISVAGKLKGIVDGETRSGLYYEGFRILKDKMPKYSIIENVKNLIGKRFRADFEQMLEDIGSLGYNNYWQVLNAKDFGVPQNRERVFIVSIRKDMDTGYFFPEKEPLLIKLKDVLEDNVDEKYYLDISKVGNLINRAKASQFSNPKANYDPTENMTSYALYLQEFTRTGFSDISFTLSSRDYKDPKCVVVKEATKKGFAESESQHPWYLSGFRIRKLTPKECWRLMGFDDLDFEKAKKAGISNSQLFKQAGNSIVVNVIEGILNNLLMEEKVQ